MGERDEGEGTRPYESPPLPATTNGDNQAAPLKEATMEEEVLEDASKFVDQSSFLLDELVWSREKHASGAKPFTRELQRAVVAMAVSWSYSEIACPSGVPGEVLEEVAREVSWSFLELPGLGEGQMLVEHPDGESEIEYFGLTLASDAPRVGATLAHTRVHPHRRAGAAGP